MANEEEFTDEDIERLLSGQLSEDKQRSVKNDLRNRPGLFKRLASRIAFDTIMREATYAEANEKAAVYLKDMQRQRRRSLLLKVFGLLFGLLLLLSIYYYVSYYQSFQRGASYIQALVDDRPDFNTLGTADWRAPIKEQRWSAAIRTLEERIATEDPNCELGEFHFYLGLIYLKIQQKANLAIPLLECAYSKQVLEQRTATLLVEAYLDQGDYDSASEVYRQYPTTIFQLSPRERNRLEE